MNGLALGKSFETIEAPESKPERQEMNQERALNFVNAQKVTLTPENTLSRCVDGRYEGAEMAMVAKPGADLGDVMAALAAANRLGINLEVSQAIDLVLKKVGDVAKFQCHTDEHAEHDHAGHGMGCGHFKKALLNPSAYGLTEEQVKELSERLNILVESGAHEEVLHGDHAEQAVMVVESDKFGLKPMRLENGELQEVFVYQKGVHDKELAELAHLLKQKMDEQGQAITEEQVQTAVTEAFSAQLQSTLKALAVGLPVFAVKFSESGIANLLQL